MSGSAGRCRCSPTPCTVAVSLFRHCRRAGRRRMQWACSQWARGTDHARPSRARFTRSERGSAVGMTGVPAGWTTYGGGEEFRYPPVVVLDGGRLGLAAENRSLQHPARQGRGRRSRPNTRARMRVEGLSGRPASTRWLTIVPLASRPSIRSWIRRHDYRRRSHAPPNLIQAAVTRAGSALWA